jgi:hypothetical protein
LLNKINILYKKGRFPKRVSIWIDEADACINIWKKYIQQLSQMGDFIATVVMITATMLPVYKCLASKGITCNLRIYENTHAAVYHKYSESIICHEYSESASNATAYVSQILTTFPIEPGQKLFCPGDKRKTSHEQVCALLIEKDFNVLILNGDSKEIRYADGRQPTQVMENLKDPDLEDELEIAKILNHIYFKHELYRAPFAVTGHLCIGRGITFMSREPAGEFIFTHGIIPDISSGEEAYQIVSRCSGNIKEFATYHPPTIYISPKMHIKIMEQERCAINLASKLYVENEETVVVTQGDINEIVGLKSAAAARPTKSNVVNILSKFYACEPEDKKAVLKQIQEENKEHLAGHKFGNNMWFREEKRDANGKWMGNMRGYKVFTFEELKAQEWGLRAGKENARATVCYRGEQVGICVRIALPEQPTNSV